MTEYKFTKDWFQQAPEVWKQLIPMLPEKKAFLEIGSFEGRSAVWIVENMMNPGDWIDCVDTWEGSEEHGQEDMRAVEARFDHNIRQAISPNRIEQRLPEMRRGHTSFYGINKHGNDVTVYKYKCSSTEMLSNKLSFQIGVVKPEYIPMYDFIYIDGSHVAKDVLTDACMAWPLLKPKGVMVFDDYTWGDPRDILHRPKAAIDAFTNLFAEELHIVHIGYQLVIQKKG